jgi:hypothetical protein
VFARTFFTGFPSTARKLSVLSPTTAITLLVEQVLVDSVCRVRCRIVLQSGHRSANRGERRPGIQHLHQVSVIVYMLPAKPHRVSVTDTLMVITHSTNNFHGRLFTPGLPHVQPGTGVQTMGADRGGMDWMEAGRYKAGSMLWTEDWFAVR